MLDFFSGNTSGCRAVDLVSLLAFPVSLKTMEVYVSCQYFEILSGN